ncbi:MAG: efflux RND transporter periplasmic adaptor subunit [Candidatus Omnitrophota bacterium]
MDQSAINTLKQKLEDRMRKHWRLIAVSIIIGFVISKIFSPAHQDTRGSHGADQASQEKKIKYWTCSMHPQINLPKPGKCPICAMDLIPVYESASGSGGDESAVSLTLNETGRKLAEVETTEVVYDEVSHEVRLVGKVAYDETKLAYISAWVPGRIDRLYVDFTGVKVRKGDHLIKLYSPELLATQEEYIQAVKNLEETKESQLSTIRDTSKSTLKSAKEKLRLYGIDDDQIQEIVKRGITEEHMIIRSPVTGTVIHKNGFDGMYVKTGDKIYTIANLSRVWLFLDAYESDIQWLHYGQHVTVEAESFPGEVFHGKIAFIDPFVNETTRTIKLRVNVDNVNERLKPGMFVRASIRSILGEEGKVYEEELAGKWICPMHPDVIKDEEGLCDICGMDLIKTSEFGFVDVPDQERKALIIPKTAPLITGKRAIVYVENEAEADGIYRYEGREVVLGPRAGDLYVVLSGLQEGDRVVTKGNFKIDSALQIQAKPSMMNPAGYYSESDSVFSEGMSASHENASILLTALPYYLAASKALSEDNPRSAAGNLEKFRDEIGRILAGNALEDTTKGIAKEIRQLRDASLKIDHDLESLRPRFAEITDVLKSIFEKYEYREDLRLYLSFCPMAFDGKGGYWFQDSDEIKNPYLGSAMPDCGEIKTEYGRKVEKTKPMAGHAGH